jgi:hypothetical protein
MAIFYRVLPGVLQRTHKMKNSIPQPSRLAPSHKNENEETFPDFEISHHGTLSLFHPLNDRANKWLGRHCTPDNEHQYLARALAIDHRYVGGIVDLAIRDGLIQATTLTKKN